MWNTEVQNVLFTEDYKEFIATGVNVSRSTSKYCKIYANKEVILSAGALRTPLVLFNSGIGPAAQIPEGVNTVINLANVGTGLHDQPVFYIPFPIQKSLPSYEFYFANYLAFFKFASTVGSRPDVELEFLVRSEALPGASAISATEAASCVSDNQFTCLLVTIVLLQTESSGTVEYDPTNPGTPIVDLTYFEDSVDVENMLQAIETVFGLMEPATAQWIEFPTEFEDLASAPLSTVQGFLQEFAETSWHYSGTARASATKETGVVDNKFNVWGVTGLRVVDASVLPTPVSGNPQFPIMILGFKAANTVAEENQ